MDGPTKYQLVDALRTDAAFRSAVRREVVGDQLLGLLGSATEMAARAVQEPKGRSDLDELHQTVAALVDVVASHSRDIDSIAAAAGVEGAGQALGADTGQALATVASGLDDLAKRLRDLTSGLRDLSAKVDSLARTTVHHGAEIEKLSAAYGRISRLVQTGFGALRDAVTTLSGQLQPGRDGGRPSLVDLRETFTPAEPVRR